ncbi:efflux RND transporter periplasmic adaptor subunit [bacterium]|nr:efflux RND transporter periplasmic adaptor subunit [bacterium]
MRTSMLILSLWLAMPAAFILAEEPEGWEFPGFTKAVTTVEVKSEVGGYLTKFLVHEGDLVAKGDPVVEIENFAAKPRIYSATAEYQSAEINLDKAKSEYQEIAELRKENKVSEQEVMLAKSKVDEAQATRERAKSKLDQVKSKYALIQVKAPVDGRVSQSWEHSGRGSLLEKDDLLLKISSQELQVHFNVPQEIFLRLKKEGLDGPQKLEVSVGLNGEKRYPHQAILNSISPKISRIGSIHCTATLPNVDWKLKPSRVGRVKLAPIR